MGTSRGDGCVDRSRDGYSYARLVARPTWPFALPVGLAAIAVALPALAPGLNDRPAQLLVGDLFPGGQELLLALILLAAARGLLLRRRVAYYVVLTLTLLSILDAMGTRDLGRALIWSRRRSPSCVSAGSSPRSQPGPHRRTRRPDHLRPRDRVRPRGHDHPAHQMTPGPPAVMRAVNSSPA